MMIYNNQTGNGSFGLRQVGGGKGPGNPHGEESEFLYYIDRNVVEGEYCVVMTTNDTGGKDEGGNDTVELMKIDVILNPNLEHLR